MVRWPADERKRKRVWLIVMSYGVLALIVLQLLLQFSHHQLLGGIFGILVFVALLSSLIFGWRNGLWGRSDRPRGPSS